MSVSVFTFISSKSTSLHAVMKGFDRRICAEYGLSEDSCPLLIDSEPLKFVIWKAMNLFINMNVTGWKADCLLTTCSDESFNPAAPLRFFTKWDILIIMVVVGELILGLLWNPVKMQFITTALCLCCSTRTFLWDSVVESKAYRIDFWLLPVFFF